uniref:Uncharacterized protein n=1 Tax=Ixodes ricinus TaxID=34613 RepID=A0A6B0U737_IXORI
MLLRPRPLLSLPTCFVSSCGCHSERDGCFKQIRRVERNAWPLSVGHVGLKRLGDNLSLDSLCRADVIFGVVVFAVFSVLLFSCVADAAVVFRRTRR